jgi:hypothetical protein
MTFAAMKYFGIDLHKISLGALVSRSACSSTTRSSRSR